MPLTRDALRASLAPDQYAAVRHRTGPLAILAGPGSGKTRVIVERVAYLLAFRAVRPESILVVTFANRAAREIRERLAARVGAAMAARVAVHTLHALGAKLLRQFGHRVGVRRGFRILDADDQETLVKRVTTDLGIDPKYLPPDLVLTAIEHAKRKLRGPRSFEGRAKTNTEREVARVYAAYQERLDADDALDFGDLIRLTVRLLEKHADVRTRLQKSYQYLLVDEFQDTDPSQYRMVRALVGPAENITVVGDDDQSLYAWRGARAANIQRFLADYPDATSVTLGVNYRSTPSIVTVCSALIDATPGRSPKPLTASTPTGHRVQVLATRNDAEETRCIADRIADLRARGVALGSIAVIYRISALSRPFETEFRARDIPHRVVGGTPFYAREEIKDVLAYLRLAQRPDEINLQRVINKPARKIGPTTVGRLLAHARTHTLSLADVLASDNFPPTLAAGARAALAKFTRLLATLRRKAVRWDARPARLARYILAETRVPGGAQGRHGGGHRADPEPEGTARQHEGLSGRGGKAHAGRLSGRRRARRQREARSARDPRRRRPRDPHHRPRGQGARVDHGVRRRHGAGPLPDGPPGPRVEVARPGARPRGGATHCVRGGLARRQHPGALARAGPHAPRWPGTRDAESLSGRPPRGAPQTRPTVTLPIPAFRGFPL